MRPAPALLLSALLVASCASPERVPQVAFPAPAPVPVPPPVTAGPARPGPGKPGPIPTRPLNVRVDCSFHDETSYGGTLKLVVEEARVQSLEATVNIPRHGACRFDLKDFRQTRGLPTVQLSHLHDRCMVHLWEQGDRVTVAFLNCQKMCSGNAWERLWPILIDRRDGSCA